VHLPPAPPNATRSPTASIVIPLPACSDLDNDDGDDLVDLDDPGCTGALDDDETDP
jgi:hypothetical protein